MDYGKSLGRSPVERCGQEFCIQNPRGTTTSWWELRTIVNKEGVEVTRKRRKHRNEEELEDSVV